MYEEIAEHLKNLGRQPGALARPLQGIQLRVQSTIGKAVEHTFLCCITADRHRKVWQGLSVPLRDPPQDTPASRECQVFLQQFAGMPRAICRQNSGYKVPIFLSF